MARAAGLTEHMDCKAGGCVMLHENRGLLEIGRMMLRYQAGNLQSGPCVPSVDEEGYLDKCVKARFRSHVENILAGIPVADLCSDDLDILQDLSGGKNRLPKSMVEALSLLARSTYADALQSGIFAVQQLEMLNSWR
jgi:hypothetical protein